MSSARNLYLYIFDTQYSSTDQQERGAMTYFRRDVSSVEQRWQSPHSYFALAMVAAQHIRIGTSNRMRCNNNLHNRGVSCTSTHDAHLQCIEQIPCRCGGLGKSHLNKRDLLFLRALRSFTIPLCRDAGNRPPQQTRLQQAVRLYATAQ